MINLGMRERREQIGRSKARQSYMHILTYKNSVHMYVIHNNSVEYIITVKTI